MKIKEVKANSVFDSRKEKTIQVSLKTSVGDFTSSSPFGKSRGRFEAEPYVRSIENDIAFLKKFSYNGEMDEFFDLQEIENLVSGKIGANSLLALESSIVKALAREQGKEVWQLFTRKKKPAMPFPIGNLIGGGEHTQLTRGKKPDFQEFLIIPRMKNFFDNFQIMKKAHESVKQRLNLRRALGVLNDENAWATSLDNESCLEVLDETRKELESELNEKIEIGSDIAASTFFSGNYVYKNPRKILGGKEQIEHMKQMAEECDLYYLEDPLQQEDFFGFEKLRGKVLGRVLVTGDDLTATNLLRLKKASQMHSISAVIIKPNQQGSILKLKEICDFCNKKEIKKVFSHRSGETEENILADLAIGFGADFIKISPIGKEREAKLNRIVEIEKSI